MVSKRIARSLCVTGARDREVTEADLKQFAITSLRFREATSERLIRPLLQCECDRNREPARHHSCGRNWPSIDTPRARPKHPKGGLKIILGLFLVWTVRDMQYREVAQAMEVGENIALLSRGSDSMPSSFGNMSGGSGTSGTGTGGGVR